MFNHCSGVLSGSASPLPTLSSCSIRCPFLFLNPTFYLQVIVTERAGHARDTLTSITNKDLTSYDGVIAVVSCLPFTS